VSLSSQELNWITNNLSFWKGNCTTKWHCWVLERPYQVLIQYYLRIMPKIKIEDHQIFAISCLCQCKLKLYQHFPTLGLFFDVILFFTMLKILLVPGSKILLKHCLKWTTYSWTSKNYGPSKLWAPKKR